MAGGYAIYVWPNIVVLYVVKFGLPTEVADGLLTYMGVLASGPLGLFLWAGLKRKGGDDV